MPARDRLSVYRQLRAPECVFAVESDRTHCHHAFVFVFAVVAAIAAHTVFRAAFIIPEARAILLQALCSSAAAAPVAATAPDLWVDGEAVGGRYDGWLNR